MHPRLPRRSRLAALLLAALALAPAAAGAGDEEDEEKEFFRKDVAVFEEFPRSFPRGTQVRLKCRLARSYVAPVLVVVYPDGDAAYLQPETASGRDVEFLLRLDPRGGRHRVALAAQGSSGVLYGARFLLMATGADGKPVDRDLDLPPEDAVYTPLDPDEDPLRLERILYHRMNGLRARQGLPPIPWHEGVARAAREALPGIARHYEETLDPRTGFGKVVHSVPFAGERGGQGPTIAGLCVRLLGWTTGEPYLPRGKPDRKEPNFVSESLTDPAWSLDERFEGYFLRKSDLRAPMVSKDVTHAAGAATWRWYGWTGKGEPPENPAPPPAGRKREVFAALVFVQLNEPKAEALLKRDRAEVEEALSRAKDAAAKAEAVRGLGRHAFPDAPARLRTLFGNAREPEVRAAALDALWLCDPAEARRLSEPLRVRLAQALQEKEEGRAAEALGMLPLLRWDAASRKEGVAGAAVAAGRAKEALKAAEAAVAAGKREEARAALEEARGRFAGLPAAAEIAAALAALGPADPK